MALQSDTLERWRCPLGKLACQFDGRLPTGGRPQMRMIAVANGIDCLHKVDNVSNVNLCIEARIALRCSVNSFGPLTILGEF